MSKNDKRNNKNDNIPIKYLLLFMTLFCTGAIFFSMTLNISGGPLHSVAGYVFLPMQKGINQTGSLISGGVRYMRDLEEVESENEELKAQVQALTDELTALKMDSYETEDYKELLDLKAKYSSHETTAASIVAKDSSRWFTTFTIDKGSKDGVEAGMNVISGTGLVGIVTRCGYNYATVRAIIDDTSKVSGMLLSTNDNVIVSGDQQLMSEEYVIRFSNLDDTLDQAKVGDPIVTSYISDQYLQGILIGYITTIEKDPNNITKSGTITPAVHFDQINNVLVILDQKVVGEEETEEEE